MPRVLPDEHEERGKRKWSALVRDGLARSGKTRQGVAEECRISRAQLDKYFNGEVTPPGKHLSAFAAALQVDVIDQLAALGWLNAEDATRHRRSRIQAQQLNVHRELQRLVDLDAEVNDVEPVTRLASPLVRQGWQVRQSLDVRGKEYPVQFAGILELAPPSAERALSSNDLVPVDLSSPLVDRDALEGLTLGERAKRQEVEQILGSARLHGQDAYWHERSRHVHGYRGLEAAQYPGLVLAVPHHLRRRHPGDRSTFLASRSTGRSIATLCFVGLPYCGAPDIAAFVSREILDWGYAGVGMLTREQWGVGPQEDHELQLEANMAERLARGDDLRIQKTAWHYNFPQTLPDSVGLLADEVSRAAVVHLRFTDESIDSFLAPYWGDNRERSRSRMLQWRDACDTAEGQYRRQFGADEWLTLDVNLTEAFIGIDPESEDRRMDYYLGDLGGQVEEWLSDIFDRRRPERDVNTEIVLEVAAGQIDIDGVVQSVSRRLAVTDRHASLLVENAMLLLNARTGLELSLLGRRLALHSGSR